MVILEATCEALHFFWHSIAGAPLVYSPKILVEDRWEPPNGT